MFLPAELSKVSGGQPRKFDTESTSLVRVDSEGPHSYLMISGRCNRCNPAINSSRVLWGHLFIVRL